MIPNNLKVLGKIINIEFKDEIDDENSLGEWDGVLKTISLKNGMGEDSKEIFIHEILECINDRCDLKMKHTQISTLSEVIWQIIKDNDLDLR